MSFKLAIVIVCALLIGLVGAKRIHTNGQRGENVSAWAQRNSLTEVAKRAKDEGKGMVTLPGPDIDYAGVDMGLDEALRDYSVVIVEPIESKSYMVDSDNIETWYRFRIREMVSQRDPKSCDTCSPPTASPQDMAPARSGEFLLAISGGTVTVDGVQVTMTNGSIPRFENGKEYLLFLSLMPSGVAVLGSGPSAVFRVNEGGH